MENAEGGGQGDGWSLIDEAEFASMQSQSPVFHWGPLGDGWEFAEAALALVQADLSRTVVDAPVLGFFVRDDEWRGRVLYVGKGPQWYFGEELYLEGDVVSATVEIAASVQDAIVDSLLGYRTFWPKCPHDGFPLYAHSMEDAAEWVCTKEYLHRFGVVGDLRLDR
jgi:hypothetical protein